MDLLCFGVLQDETDQRQSGGQKDVSEDVCNSYVTWSALEDALNGSRDSPPTTQPVSADPVVTEKSDLETNGQLDPVSTQRDDNLLPLQKGGYICLFVLVSMDRITQESC